MNFRIKIAKHFSIGPSGLRFIGRHFSIGRSGFLLFGRRGSIFIPSNSGIRRTDWHTLDNRNIYDHKTGKFLPTWYYNAKYGRNKPGTCAYQEIRLPRPSGKSCFM